MRQSCREVRNRVAYVINHRNHIDPSLRLILFPIRQRLMHIKDRLVSLKAELIEEGDRQSKQLSHRFLMITPHRHDTVGLIEQRACHLALHMPGRISAMLQEPGTHNGMDRLRLGLDPGGANTIQTLRTKKLLERILRCQAPKDVACTDEEDRLHGLVRHARSNLLHRQPDN